MSNDILRTANPPDGRLQSGNEFGDSWKYKLKVFLGSHLATYAAMNYTIKTNPTLFDLCKSLGACYRPRPPNIYTAEVIEDAIPHTLNFTAKLAEEIRADHRNVVVLLIPTREQVDDELWAKAALEYGTDANEHRFTLNSRLAAGLKAAGVDVLDLTPIAVAHQRATGEQLYFKYDGHWNPAGQALAAKHLADFIRSKWRP